METLYEVLMKGGDYDGPKKVVHLKTEDPEIVDDVKLVLDQSVDDSRSAIMSAAVKLFDEEKISDSAYLTLVLYAGSREIHFD